MRYEIQLFGPLEIKANGCVDRSVRGKKEQALIALLARAPNHRRSRTWLKAMLWDNADADRSSASLRQVIAQLNRAFSGRAPLIIADRTTVWLNPQTVSIASRPLGRATLLEGLDVNSETFEDWLRDERYAAENSPVEDGGGSTDLTCAAPPCGDPPAVLPSVAILAPQCDDQDRAAIRLCHALGDQFAAAVRNHAFIALFDQRDTKGDQVSSAGANAFSRTCAYVALSAVSMGSALQVSIRILETGTGQLLWARQHVCTIDDAVDLSAVGQLASSAVDAVHDLIYRTKLGRTGAQPSLMMAVHQFFSQSPEGHTKACEIFDNFCTDSGMANAWRAYALAVAQAERMEGADPSARDMIHAHCANAVEMDPYNPIVRAITGHISAFVFRDKEAADAHFSIASTGASALPLVWNLMAIFSNYSGEFNRALIESRRARALFGSSPYAFFFETPVLFANTLSGNHGAAVSVGKRILADRPRYLGAMRHMVASLALNGDIDDALRLTEAVRRSDKQFTPDGIEDPSYPLPNVQSRILLQQAFGHFGTRMV